MEDFLTSEEVLLQLRISRRTLDRLLASGQLTAQRIGEHGSLRFKRGDVHAVLRPRTPLAGTMKHG
jgi:excisionase family DNA binding protein